MARPRKDKPDDLAVPKMRSAFWQLLEQKPCNEISVTELARVAGVNKNSFYYHFKSMDDFVEEALRMNFDTSIPIAMLSAMRGDRGAVQKLVLDIDLCSRLRNLTLFVRQCATNAQRDIFKGQVLDVWLSVSGRSIESFSYDERLTMEFTLAGLLEIIGNWEIPKLDELDTQAKALEEDIDNASSADSFITTFESLLQSDLFKRIAALILPVLFPGMSVQEQLQRIEQAGKRQDGNPSQP